MSVSQPLLQRACASLPARLLPEAAAAALRRRRQPSGGGGGGWCRRLRRRQRVRGSGVRLRGVPRCCEWAVCAAAAASALCGVALAAHDSAVAADAMRDGAVGSQRGRGRLSPHFCRLALLIYCCFPK